MKQIIKHLALSITLYLLVLPLLADAQTLVYEDSHTLINDYAASSGPEHKFWPGTIYVDQTLEEGPLESGELEYAIRRAIWTWSERSGKQIEYKGDAVVETGGATRRITVVWSDIWELFLLTSKITVNASTRSWYYLETGEMAGALIMLDENQYKNGLDACGQYILTHEIGHAIGVIGHSSNKHDVMYPEKIQCRYAVTTNDVKMTNYGKPGCYVEILDDSSVYFPGVKGFAAYLTPEESVVWHLDQLSPVENDCSNVKVNDELDIDIKDLRGYDVSYKWAKLRYIGDDRWLLIGGE